MANKFSHLKGKNWGVKRSGSSTTTWFKTEKQAKGYISKASKSGESWEWKKLMNPYDAQFVKTYPVTKKKKQHGFAIVDSFEGF
tara:strand:+ start:177 stop:428 length:252 start_codon:yes stop_codon:yes gene_type:complete